MHAGDAQGWRTKKGPQRGPHPELEVRLGLSGAEAGGTEGGDQAKGHQEGRCETVESAFEADEGHGAHLEGLCWEPRGSGAVRVDDLCVALSEQCIDHRFHRLDMRFRICRSCDVPTVLFVAGSGMLYVDALPP